MNRNIINQIARWLVTAVLLASLLSFSSSQQVSAERPSTPASIQLVVDTELDFNDPTHQACTDAPGDCSLRGAISKANGDASQTYEIVLAVGTYTLSILGFDDNLTGDLDIHRSIRITGAGASSTTIDAQGIWRVIRVHPGVSMTIQGVTVMGGRSFGGGQGTPGFDSEDGAGIYNSGSLLMRDCVLRDNRTGDGGDGFICVKCQPADDTGGKSGNGGGVYNSGWLKLENTIIIENHTGTGGTGGTGRICNIGNGGKSGDGGGIYNTGTMLLIDSQVMDNSIGTGGGSVCALGGDGGSGGGVYNAGMMQVNGTTFYSNTAGTGGEPWAVGGSGGGIYQSSQGIIELTNAMVVDNHLIPPGGKGSGIFLEKSATLIHTTFARNTGEEGSGIYFIGESLTLTNTILVSQTVGIFTSGGIVQLDSTLWGSGAWANLSDWGGSGSHTSIHDYHVIPGFVDPEAGDYHILSTSPAVDLGVQTGTTVDIDNQPRPNPSTGIPDLGADEYWLYTPISEVSISGPSLIFTSLDATYTAIISPTEATPNITYYWFPEPKIGQGTDTVDYNILIPGTNTITVTAYNAGSRTTASQQVIVLFGPHIMFLPLVAWKGLLSP